MDLSCITADRKPDLFERAQQLVSDAFAPFMDHSVIINKYWSQLYQRWADWQYVLYDTGSDEPIVLGNCFPLHWDHPAEDLPAGGVEWALEEAVRQNDHSLSPNLACAFQIIISKQAQGKGLSYRAVDTMIEIVRQHAVPALIAPVRPNRKERHPEMPFNDFVRWDREDGLPVDDWLRVHVRLGGRVLHVCERSFVVNGSLDQWEEWTGIRFAENGPRAVPGALVPVEVDIESERATYTEPNIWVWHDVP